MAAPVTEQKAWIENEELFLSELRKGKAWQNYTADAIRELGFTVEVGDMGERKSVSEIRKFANEFDIKVNGLICEVKSRRQPWETYGTSPYVREFPFDSMFVDTERGYDSKVDKPAAYIFVSTVTRDFCILPTATRKQWSTVGKFDNVRKIHDIFLTADTSLFRPLDHLEDILFPKIKSPEPERAVRHKTGVVYDQLATVTEGDMVACPSSGCWCTVGSVESSNGKVNLTWSAGPPGSTGFCWNGDLEVTIRRKTTG